MRRLSARALGGLLGLLAACGGGGDVPAPPTALPDTAVPDAVAPVVPGPVPGPVIPVVVPPDVPAPGGSAECSDSNQRAWLQTYMQDQYFWNQPLRAPLATAPDLNAYFRSMLNLPLDRLLQQATPAGTSAGVAVAPPAAPVETPAAPGGTDIRSRDGARTRDREGR